MRLNFYPGPSKLFPSVRAWLLEAFDCGILGKNHRSSAFEQLFAQTLRDLKNKLQIPKNYEIFVVSAATEVWEMVAQDLGGAGSVHFWNGAFGKKWAESTQKITQKAENQAFGIEDLFPTNLFFEKKILCLTQNETSNGTQTPQKILADFRKNNPDSWIAVDAVSSLGGIELDWRQADVWFASVQKCLGLPSGLAVMICSERLLERIRAEKQQKYYNSFWNILQNQEKFQTTHTPNILGIYLLGRLAQTMPPISETAQKIKKQAKNWYEFFEKKTDWELLVKNQAVRSDTLIVLEGEAEKIQKTLFLAEKQGIILGKGYGIWKENSLRIANFPAIEEQERDELKYFFEGI